MRVPTATHTSRPWRIHELTPDFRVEDVWELPGRGGPDDFPRLVRLVASLDPSQGRSRVARMLWATRWKVGELLGWDSPDAGLGCVRWLPGSDGGPGEAKRAVRTRLHGRDQAFPAPHRLSGVDARGAGVVGPRRRG
jgi:hypothetical protein